MSNLNLQKCASEFDRGHGPLTTTSSKDLDTADRQRNTGSQLETDVAKCRWTWTSWGVVATDLSYLCVMMMMMMN